MRMRNQSFFLTKSEQTNNFMFKRTVWVLPEGFGVFVHQIKVRQL
jgi:hypothetical protein